MNEVQTKIDEIRAREKELKDLGYEFGWHKPERIAGYVYIAVNKLLPKMVKIGYADGDRLARRIKELRGTGLPEPYHCYAAYGVLSRLEDKNVHQLIDKLNPKIRYSADREFYTMEPEQAFKIFEHIAEFSGTQSRLKLNPLDDDYFKDKSKPEPIKAEAEAKPEKASRGRHVSMAECGIRNGEIIVCEKTGCRATVTDAEKNQISVPGEPDVKTMSGYCKKYKVHGNGKTVNGSCYFSYNGTRINSIMIARRYPNGDFS